MKRRDIIRYTALATGAALSAPLIFSLESCQVDSKAVAQQELSFFTKEKMRLVTSICDTILPKSDSPSASDVNVPQMIDHMVGNVYKTKDKEAYKTNFAKLFGYLEKQSKGKGFESLSTTDREELITKLLGSNQDVFADAKKSLSDIKQQTIAYYLNTEEVATKYLNYLPVPGQYEGCISLDSVGGKAWAI